MINKERVITIILSILVGALLVLGVQNFLSKYYFDFHIIKAKVVSPIPNSQTSPLPQKPIIFPSLTPTPTKTPLKKKPITVGPQSYIIEKIKAVFGKDGDVAVQVAMAESHLRYNAQNSCCTGLFQIHRVHAAKYAGKDIMDVDTNIEVAHEIFLASGWFPWEVCSKHIVDCGI